MTTTTTLLSLIPIFTSTGRGADIMIPMAIPTFGGMVLEGMTNLVVPTLYCAAKEHELRKAIPRVGDARNSGELAPDRVGVTAPV